MNKVILVESFILANPSPVFRIQPNSVRAYLYRGALKFETKNYPLAIQDLSAAIKLGKKFS